MKRLALGLTFAAALLVITPQTGNAIPAFARKYGFNCNMCHTSFTKLNDFGQRYRQNGYQIAGQEGGEKTVFETAPPIAFRATFGLEAAHTRSADSYGFNIFGLDLLSAGVMHKNVSFLMIYTPRLDEPGADFTGAEPSQPGALESANLVFSNLVSDALHLRVGRFEPAFHLVSSKRSYYMAEPYEVYAFGTTPANTFSFDDNQMGLELTGVLHNGLRASAGVVNGNGAHPDNNKPKDVYASLQQVIGRGEGQSAGQRVGVFGYAGWQPTRFPAEPGAVGTNNKSFSRLGANLSLNYRTCNLTVLFLHGVDDKALNLNKPGLSYKYSGGFAELDYAGLSNNRLLTSVMFNWVRPPSSDEDRRINAFSALVRYYLGDWMAVNVALHGEFTHREVGVHSVSKQDLGRLLVDFDF
jgi:hypothetical protein